MTYNHKQTGSPTTNSTLAIIIRFVNLLHDKTPLSEAISATLKELSEPTDNSGSDLLSICFDDADADVEDSESSSDEPPPISSDSDLISSDSPSTSTLRNTPSTSLSSNTPSTLTSSTLLSSDTSSTSTSKSSDTESMSPSEVVDTTKIIKYRILDQIFKGVCVLAPRPTKAFSGSYVATKVWGNHSTKREERTQENNLAIEIESVLLFKTE
eukprot:TRINITY_DN111_c0_g1_i1.p1 TRINITY_DN111_c0_g1~~TRINITY_DN111_c0_g1_i1.p1  ORF type:complete len:212 (-),score=37.32 TRINITY_DN111_c0_g1_i1:24-659(-)